MLLTDLSHSQISEILAGKLNEGKMRLAKEIVRFYHGDAGAEKAQSDWDNIRKNKDPDVIPEVTIASGELVNGQMTAVKLIVASGFCKSNNEARQKLKESAFNYGPDREKPADDKASVNVTDGLVVRLGKKFARVRLS
jgi:tyrosyl-tRNA synthetase